MPPSFRRRKPQPIFSAYLVTFRENDGGAGESFLRNQLGVKEFARSRDWGAGQMPLDTGAQADLFDELNVCCLKCQDDEACELHAKIPQSAVLAVEQDHEVFTLARNSPDALGESPLVPPATLDSGAQAWGIAATGVDATGYTGLGVRVALLDTGLDTSHPDFAELRLAGRSSFLPERTDPHETDLHGHGTYCAGLLFGPQQPVNAPRYGIASEADAYIGSVLDADGRGTVRQVLAGLNWAVANRCDVITLAMGAEIAAPSVAFEESARRSLQAGGLIVAAAGNNARRTEGEFGFVARPANSHSAMAVSALDRRLQLADFSARSSMIHGGEVDLAAPGVDVFSTWPQGNYRSLSGTSPATAMAAGIAALISQANEVSGRMLWQLLLEHTQSLPLPSLDIGAGFVQAPR